jgi:hypothetical protein
MDAPLFIDPADDVLPIAWAEAVGKPCDRCKRIIEFEDGWQRSVEPGHYVHRHCLYPKREPVADTPTYEKHTTHTDALDTLGTLIGPDEKRDAIHLAVIPAVCGAAKLHPGEHVYYDGDSGAAFPVPVGEGVGIVDPFLRAGTVNPGDRFWLVVYPREITSLRHVWEHPAFPPSGETETVLTAPVVHEVREIDGNEYTPDDSETWLRAALSGYYSDDIDDDDMDSFDALIDKIADPYDDYVTIRGTEAHESIGSSIYDHIENMKGTTIIRRATSFSCSC